MKNRALGVILFLFIFATTTRAGLKIYFLRHAEGGHNVAKEWLDKPHDQWPAYVGNENAFTPKGEEQVAAVPAKLVPFSFDYIACSPLWRTRNTILPFLQERNLKAEIWPELEEFTYQQELAPLPQPGVDVFDGGAIITIPANESAWFSRREGVRNLIKIAKEKKQATADIEALMARMIEMLHARFGGREQSVLLVGHGGNGSVLLKKLLRDTNIPWPQNAALWMVEEQPDGTFRLMIANDQAR